MKTCDVCKRISKEISPVRWALKNFPEIEDVCEECRQKIISHEDVLEEKQKYEFDVKMTRFITELVEEGILKKEPKSNER